MPYYKENKQNYSRATGSSSSSKRPSAGRRVVQYAKGAIKRRYGGAQGVGNIIRDVARLKTIINSEKKRFDLVSPTTPQILAQCGGATTYGTLTFDITPVPPQGNTSVTRNGNSIRLHSSFMQFQFFQQTNVAAPMKVRLVVAHVMGSQKTSALALQEMYSPNAFANTLIDYNSQRNPDYFNDYKIVAQKEFTFPVDSFSGVRQIKNVQIPITYSSHHIRFKDDGVITIASGQLVLFMMADSGNSSSTTTSSLNNVPVPAINTGLYVNFDMKHYFYDN